MGFGSIFRKVSKLASPILKNPLVKMGAGLVPGLGTALTIGSMGMSAASMLQGSGGGGGGMPALPMLGGGGGGGMPMGVAPTAGQRTIFGNDPNVVEALKPYVISKGNLKMFYRAPKGYVIRRDSAGDPMGVPKYLARKMLGWKPAKKPLLSIRDTQAIKHAGVAIKKLQKAEKMARKIANWHSPHRAPSKNIIVTGRQIGRKAA